jgi:hypothetical protein
MNGAGAPTVPSLWWCTAVRLSLIFVCGALKAPQMALTDSLIDLRHAGTRDLVRRQV